MAVLNKRFLVRLRWELRELRDALRTWRFYWTLCTMALGITLSAVALNGLVIPRNLFSTGTSGIALLLFYALGWPGAGVFYLLLNIPLFLIGWREYALKYVLISALGAVMFSGALELTRDVFIPAPDPLMATIIAGIMMGAGGGFYLRFGGSAGGLDILATYIRKKLAIPMGSSINAVNAFNLVGAVLLFDLSVAFYSAVFMWVASWVLERVYTGFSQHRAVFIITRHHEAVAERIRTRLNRGVTFINAIGSYSGQPMQMVYTIINMYELGRIKDIMFTLDPGAYLMVTPTTEVIGRRFHTWEEEGYRPPIDWSAVSAPS